jgi:hypothetical protein
VASARIARLDGASSASAAASSIAAVSLDNAESASKCFFCSAAHVLARACHTKTIRSPNSGLPKCTWSTSSGIQRRACKKAVPASHTRPGLHNTCISCPLGLPVSWACLQQACA